MKRTFLGLLVILASVRIVAAQTANVSGSVKDDKGNALSFAFILDSQYKNAALSDSVGNFTIKAHPDSKLQIALPGYKDKTVDAGKGGDNLQVVLSGINPDGSSNSSGNVAAQVTTREEKIDVTSMRVGGQIAPGHQKGSLVGSQYLFENFAHGFVVEASGNILYNSDKLFDYDKIGGGLLTTGGGKAVQQIDWDQVKGFTLYSPTGVRFDFEKAPEIDKSHYVQALASGPKYKIYKLIKTRFVRSDYVNNGAAPHGHDYDEFVDDADYFVIDVSANQVQKLSLKKKSIKQDFAKEAEKVNKYLSDNSGDIDDTYLSKLGAFMNQ